MVHTTITDPYGLGPQGQEKSDAGALAGYTALHLAIIEQALKDAAGLCPAVERNYWQHKAVAWLDNTPGFRQTCRFAGINPDYLLQRFRDHGNIKTYYTDMQALNEAAGKTTNKTAAHNYQRRNTPIHERDSYDY